MYSGLIQTALYLDMARLGTIRERLRAARMKREPNAAPQCELKKRRVEEGRRESKRNTLAWDQHVQDAAQQKQRANELSRQNAKARGG